MEVRYLNFGGNTNTAYDVYQNAQPQTLPQELPEELPRRQNQQQKKAGRTIAPFTLFGCVLSVMMIILVVFGYVQFFEASSKASSLKNELNSLQNTQMQLLSKYENHIDLQVIEKRANELGMVTPKNEQIIYLDLSGEDNAEIYQEKTTNIFVEVVEAVEQSVAELIAYLAPSAA